MEKVRFGTHEFDLIPMGISSADKTRSIRFVSDLSFDDVFNIVTNLDNYGQITIIGQDGNPQNVYTDTAAFKHIGYTKDASIDQETTADVYSVTYSVDAIEKELRETKDKNAILENRLAIIDGAFWDLLIDFIPNIPMN